MSKKMKLNLVKIKISILLLIFLSSCGYHVSGTGGSLSKGIRTISIPVFDNNSAEPLIQRQFTDAVRQAFLTDGRLRLSSPDKADLLLNGLITNYYNRSVAFNRDDVVTESIITLGIKVKVLDQINEKVYMENSMTTKWDYRSDSLVINSEAARQVALQEAYRDLALRIVSLVIDKF
jgi:outer membrane lipopolysaccharide assembly protein LptE/RlpB